jgi:hypothetical protein
MSDNEDKKYENEEIPLTKAKKSKPRTEKQLEAFKAAAQKRKENIEMMKEIKQQEKNKLKLEKLEEKKKALQTPKEASEPDTDSEASTEEIIIKKDKSKSKKKSQKKKKIIIYESSSDSEIESEDEIIIHEKEPKKYRVPDRDFKTQKHKTTKSITQEQPKQKIPLNYTVFFSD